MPKPSKSKASQSNPNSFSDVQVKIESWCAYQERCSKDVLDKLSSWGIDRVTTAKLLEHLKTQRFVDDRRFAEAFVSGKTRIKKWGLRKTQLKLKSKKISESLIASALESIDQDDYLRTLKELAEKKWKMIKDSNIAKRKVRLQRFLFSKGYEVDLVLAVVRGLEKK